MTSFHRVLFNLIIHVTNGQTSGQIKFLEPFIYCFAKEIVFVACQIYTCAAELFVSIIHSFAANKITIWSDFT